MSDSRYDAISGGLLMLGAGIVLALHQAGYFDARALWPWWPLLAFVQAGRALANPRACARGWVMATMWSAAAILLLLHTHGYHVLRAQALLPAVLVFVGLRLLTRGNQPRPTSEDTSSAQRSPSQDTLDSRPRGDA